MLATWNRSFRRALSQELKKASVMVFSLATIGLDGSPSNRNCAFRGYLANDPKTNVLEFTTDKRSRKYAELERDARFEACFYFHEAHQQFRLKGKVGLLSAETDRPEVERVWKLLAGSMKKSFGKPAPGSVMTEELRSLVEGIEKSGENDEASELNNFRLVCLIPDRVDRLDLGRNGANRRFVYELTSDQWTETEVCA